MNHHAPPKIRYADDLQAGRIMPDAAQSAAVDALQSVFDQLLATPPKRRLGKLRWKSIPGLYFWGGVGRGKTYLMDSFYDALPFTRKRRTHFHRFMHEVHARRLRHKDQQDPLALIAAELAEEARVLCFDEFFVSDIADAMILGRLTERLFHHGVTLIATSNRPPDDLYKDGLQRQNFLPAIAQLKKHCRVLNVDGGIDYRLRVLQQAELYHHPIDPTAEESLKTSLSRMTTAEPQWDEQISVNDRNIPVHALTEDVAWFRFSALCEGPRGSADYTELARSFHTILVSEIPQLTATMENETRRFITLVDEFYDRGVKLILSAAVPRESLYAGDLLRFEFERTLSRLIEMGTQDYLARPHLP